FGRSRSRAPAIAAAFFVTGYLVVWGLLGVPAHAIEQVASWAAPRIGSWSGPIAGVLLIACGIYQLTPWKDACLRHCQLPHLFLGHHWRDGFGGALLLGAQHGLYCAGCCASIMAVLLVVGVMDMSWMVGLSALIFLEKVVPAGRVVGRVAGCLLCVAGAMRL